ncbi:MAG: dienelactone hydrolase family protein, partial [Flavobacteriales bacterium]|nr:dienelactone hydrolase family protein [Flavobacteriales bacterium]
LLIFIISISMHVSAQDYSKQVNVFKQSFIEKRTKNLNQYLSSELKFDPIPISSTPAVITNIVSQFPKLNSITILESEKGKAKIKYDFVDLGVSESYIHFDEAGKIIRIEFIENLIKQQMDDQKKQQPKGVKQPIPSELSKKYPSKKITFKSEDGLLVTGNLYEIGKDKPIILLCHQARYNKFEYADIAPKLNELGYNCLAIDQRSGGSFAGKPNETYERATKKGITDITYLDAEQDIIAAVNYLSNKYDKKITAWGSSYSSGLVLYVSANNDNVNASISFSPGDYFDKKEVSLTKTIAAIQKPFFITSSKAESPGETQLLKDITLSASSVHFIPESAGFHGSKALWTGQEGAEEYWTAIKSFLTTIYPKD